MYEAVTYEETSHIHESKINLYIHQYAYTLQRNMHLVYGQHQQPKNFEKIYTNGEMMKKLLRCIPRSK